MLKILAAIAFSVVTALTQAAELTLFEMPLRTAGREEMRSAIIQSGGRLKSSSSDIDKYDASQIGLPGATSLDVVYLDGKLVLAQYELRFDQKTEERMRKMLTAKYGQPRGETRFDAEYLSGGKYRWLFDNTMELVFSKNFGSSVSLLSYVNRTEQARLERRVKEQDKRSAEHEAASKKSVF